MAAKNRVAFLRGIINIQNLNSRSLANITDMKAITYYPVISKTRHRNALDCYERNLAFKSPLRRALLRGSRHNNMSGFSRLFHLRKNQV